MASIADFSVFSSSQFLQDIKKTAQSIGAPYSEAATLTVIKIYEDCFKEGAVIWRTTNRPDDRLNYRFYARKRIDTISISTQAGFLEKGNHMARLVTSWSTLYNGDTEQWCDFDAEIGLAKNWVNLRGRRQVDDILAAEEVPEAVRANGPTFHNLGLELVRFLAVDYASSTLNLYFTAPGPVSEQQATQYVELAQSPPPTKEEFQDMCDFLNPKGFAFAVTMEYATGKITRVAFYALDMPSKKLPTVNDKVRKFFSEAPSYDQVQTRNIAWSYGKGGNKYMKAECSYCGGLAALLKDVGAPTGAPVTS
ncbi:prenyltransferase-like protein [Bisporella sp. PMI_857]|nr:prenyltransferase-like protein [Bisporella sp. PMI_857]